MNISYPSEIPPGMLLRAIQGKQSIIDYYEQLQTMAPNETIGAIIGDIIHDEINHLNLFTRLHQDLFGERPEFPAGSPPGILSFADGITFAIMSELRLYSFYGNVFLTDTNPAVRDTFLRALLDENSHSTQFNFIFSKLLPL